MAGTLRPDILRSPLNPRRYGLSWFQALTVVAIFAVAAVAGDLGYQMANSADSATTPPTIVAARLGSVATTVTATGSLATNSQFNLTFPTSGRVDQVQVKVGDQVTAGQALATLDATDLTFQAKQAQSSLSSAQARLEQLYNATTPADAAAARQSVASAQAGLDKAQNDLSALLNPTVADVAGAQQQVAAGEATLQKAQNDLSALQNPTAVDVAGAQQQVAASQAAYQKAENDLSALQNPSVADVAGAQQQVTSAQAALQKAQNDLQNLLHPSAADIDTAQQSVT